MRRVVRLRLGILTALALLFLVAVFYQQRQVTNLHDLEGNGINRVTWYAREVERQYWRLIVSLNGMRDPLQPTRGDALRQRFEIFWSRLPPLIEGRVGARVRTIPGFPGTVRYLLRELKALAPVVASVGEPGGASYWTLQEHLDRLRPRVRTLVLEAVRADERWTANRLAAFKGQLDRLTMAIAGVLLSGLLLIIFTLWEHRRAECHAASAEGLGKRLNDVLDASSDWMWETDAEGRFSYFSERAQELHGAALAGVIGKRREDLAAGDEDPEKWAHHLARLKARQPFRDFAYHLRLPGEDAARYISVSGAPRYADDGRYLGYRGAARDIGDAEQAAAALARSEARHRALIEHAPVAIVELDLDGTILSANREALRVVGVGDSERLIGRPGGDWIGATDRPALRAAAEAAIAGETRELRCNVCPEGGETRVVDLSVVPLRDVRGRRVVRLMALARDVTNEQRLSAELVHQASHDALTGLPNRRAMESNLTRALESTRGGAAHHVFCCIGLDHFKVINDGNGHAAGDRILRQVGALLRAKVRASDLVARIGGDEFAVLMENCPLDKGLQMAGVLREALAEQRVVGEDGSVYPGGASIGVVCVDRCVRQPEQILRAADSACHAAKRGGRNRVQIYSSEDRNVIARERQELAWVERIRDAVAEDNLILYAQTIAPLGIGGREQVGYEILLRMRGGDGAPIPPGAFLPVAERHGLSSLIDRWVIEHSLGWLADNPRHLARLTKCSINLSGASVGDREFVAFLLDAVSRSPVAASKLCFELTETAAVADIERVVMLMGELRRLGCCTALDDFGSGLSSFGYLKTFPVDLLKIDGIFIRGLSADPRNQAIVRSINEVAHTLGKRTVAEFVEDAGCLAAVRELGIDYAQGYAVARPRPLTELGDRAHSGRSGASTELRLIEGRRSA